MVCTLGYLNLSSCMLVSWSGQEFRFSLATSRFNVWVWPVPQKGPLVITMPTMPGCCLYTSARARTHARTHTHTHTHTHAHTHAHTHTHTHSHTHIHTHTHTLPALFLGCILLILYISPKPMYICGCVFVCLHVP